MLNTGTTVGGYRIEGVLGRGGMAVVYEATQLSLGRSVALKALRAELADDRSFAERFRREGQLQASFEHPNALDVYEALETPEGLFIAMRIEPGPTLAGLLAEGRLGGDRALRLLAQVADALDAAHAAGLVHRDVKPQNVLVSLEDVAFLGDFGLTKAGDGSEVTVAGAMMGTLAYLAPEVVRGGHATPASDRYAFAAMLFQCLTGDVVFPRSSDAAVLYAHTSEAAPRASERRAELPPALDRILSAGLAKDPGKRPASAAGLVRDAVEAVGATRLQTLPPPTPVAPGTWPPQPARPAGEPARRRLLPALALGALCGAAIGAGAFALADSDDDRDDPQSIAAPPVPRDARPLGSVLTSVGRTVACDGGRVRAAARACSVAQAALPGRRTIVPADGAIFGWAVRGARGEIALQVLRPRDGGASQVGRSQYETVNNAGLHRFATNLDVQRGDIVALEVTEGAAIGIADADGATTQRWFPTRRGKPPEPPDRRPGSGLDAEVLVRADYVPGVKRRQPPDLRGNEAASAPAGRVKVDRSLTFTDGRRVRVALVELRDRVVVDLFRRGRRVARMDATGFKPGGRVVNIYAINYDDSEAAGELGVEWVNDNSARVREHYYGVLPRALEFYD